MVNLQAKVMSNLKPYIDGIDFKENKKAVISSDGF
jgi:hypothetical protein